MSGVHSTCPYCGVGCGVVARTDGRVVADESHPANLGRMCTKGSALSETLDDTRRLLTPLIGGRRATWNDAMSLTAATFRTAIEEHGPDSVAFYVSGQCLTEDYYVANKLMKGFIGSANIDTNSRLCMASSVSGHIRAFGADLVPCIYEDFEEADLIVLVGSNLAWCHPVLHQRLQAARAARGTKIVVVDPRRSASCETADLHLPIAPGSDVALFNGLLAAIDQAGATDREFLAAHGGGFAETFASARRAGADTARLTTLPLETLQTFYQLFIGTPRALTVYSQGVNQSSAGTDKVNAIINCHLATGRIGKPGAGPFSVTGQPNAMGGREVGGLATQLAAHMALDDPAARDRVQRFWDAPRIAATPGLKAIDLFDAVGRGEIRALWVMATNPVVSLPHGARVREALRACPFLVVSDCWPTDTSDFAHVVLPASAWGEKDGTVTNSERRISRQRAFRKPPGEAQPDWAALAELGRRLGYASAFAWDSAAAIFREHAALSAFENDGARIFDLGGLAGVSDDAYERLAPVRWPVRAAGQSSGRLFADGVFQTGDGRARMVPVSHRPPAYAPDAAYPLVLNTGRIRDQWHTMTRTGLVPRLFTQIAAPEASLSPKDAARLGIAAGDLVRLRSPHGEATLRAAVTPAQPAGQVFAPMHWTRRFAASGGIAEAVGGGVDLLSGQPELKATPVQVERIDATWHGLLVRRDDADISRAVCWWSKTPMLGGFVFELTGVDALPASAAFAKLTQALLGQCGSDEILELADPARRTWRFVVLAENAVRACFFLGPARRDLPLREDAAQLLSGSREASRAVLLMPSRVAALPDTGWAPPRLQDDVAAARAG